MRDFCGFNCVVFTLLVVGGVNYGLVGFFDYNLLEVVFGHGTVMRIVYSFIGVAAFMALFFGWKRSKHGCHGGEHHH